MSDWKVSAWEQKGQLQISGKMDIKTTYAARDDEGDGLDIRIRNSLETAHDLVLMDLWNSMLIPHSRQKQSQSQRQHTATPRFGKNAIPRWGSDDLYSDR